jgi:hypothetical protein
MIICILDVVRAVCFPENQDGTKTFYAQNAMKNQAGQLRRLIAMVGSASIKSHH